MPLALVWSPSRDAMIRQARGRGLSWASIARGLGVSRTAALARGQHLGLGLPVQPRETADVATSRVSASPRPILSGPARLPLPPGHEVTWGAIIAGTVLDGVGYPDISLDAIVAGPRANGAAEFATASAGEFGAQPARP